MSESERSILNCLSVSQSVAGCDAFLASASPPLQRAIRGDGGACAANAGWSATTTKKKTKKKNSIAISLSAVSA